MSFDKLADQFLNPLTEVFVRVHASGNRITRFPTSTPNVNSCDVKVIIQRATERFRDVTPRIISDNGPQFIARDFKVFVRQLGVTHVRTSPYYPQSNGKLERFHRTLS